MKNANSRGRPRSRNVPGKRVPNRNQVFESNGPGVRVRGNAQQLVEKYLAMARDAAAQGDRILAENCHQHADHYQRVLNALAGRYVKPGELPASQSLSDDDDGMGAPADDGRLGPEPGNELASAVDAADDLFEGTPGGYVMPLDAGGSAPEAIVELSALSDEEAAAAASPEPVSPPPRPRTPRRRRPLGLSKGDPSTPTPGQSEEASA
ncbi:DUF4167 domain-containing protein [Phaeovibrio sulfidiphilus]|uniref:DUF4167 domain-containing protein n=1 Tax=Phaeovibrio sulfidiphilus TaxID=1220600 RepID=UPI0030845F4B